MKIRINNRINDMPGRCSSSVELTPPEGKNHIKQPTDIVSIKDPTDIVGN